MTDTDVSGHMPSLDQQAEYLEKLRVCLGDFDEYTKKAHPDDDTLRAIYLMIQTWWALARDQNSLLRKMKEQDD